MKSINIVCLNCVCTNMYYNVGAIIPTTFPIVGGYPFSSRTIQVADNFTEIGYDVQQVNSSYVFWGDGGDIYPVSNNSVGFTSPTMGGLIPAYQIGSTVYILFGPKSCTVSGSVVNGSILSQTSFPVSPYLTHSAPNPNIVFKPNSGYEIDYITITGGLFNSSVTISNAQCKAGANVVVSQLSSSMQTRAYISPGANGQMSVQFFSLLDSGLVVKAYYKATSKITISTVCSPSAGGTITPSNPQITPGSQLSLSIAANAGYVLSYVMKGNTNMGAVNTLIDSYAVPTTITAYFTAYSANFNITASAGANGKITPSGTVVVANGGSQTFSITPNSGYEIDAVTVDGLPKGAISSYTFTNVKATHTISATFKALQGFPITITSTGPGTTAPVGTVAATQGTNKSITMQADAGARIASVTADGVLQPLYTGKTTGMAYTFFEVQAAHALDVVYELIQHTINSSAGEHGTITPLGDTLVADKASQSYVITPDKGYKIAHVYVDGNEVTIPSTGILFIDD